MKRLIIIENLAQSQKVKLEGDKVFWEEVEFLDLNTYDSVVFISNELYFRPIGRSFFYKANEFQEDIKKDIRDALEYALRSYVSHISFDFSECSNKVVVYDLEDDCSYPIVEYNGLYYAIQNNNLTTEDFEEAEKKADAIIKPYKEALEAELKAAEEAKAAEEKAKDAAKLADYLNSEFPPEDRNRSKRRTRRSTAE